jgi:ribosomal protein S18 acetylase RimI-like enzyme
MMVTLRTAIDLDVPNILDIEKEMYGEDYTKGTFEKCLNIFPQGFLVAEAEEDGERQVVGFVVAERVSKVQAIPYVHEPKDFFDAKGNVLYLQGFGVKARYQKEGVGTKLYRELLRVAKDLGIGQFEVLCNEEDAEDRYEMSILRELHFRKHGRFDWEIYPGRIHVHTAWVKDIRV